MSTRAVLSFYRLLTRIATRVSGDGTFAASLSGRREAPVRWRQWAESRAPLARLAWIHAASIGEALAAQPIMQRIRASAPGITIALTHSSPSVTSWPGTFGADAVGFVPFDLPREVAAVFDALRPDLLVFSRADLWPELLLAARQRRVPVAVLGALVRPGSLRTRWPARPLLSSLHRDLRFVGACTGDDAAAWEALGAPAAAITVTGDPRHDQVLERPVDLRTIARMAAWMTGPVLVAGSTEPEEETLVVEAFAELRHHHPEARLLVVPHNPHEETLGRIERLMVQRGIPTARLAEGAAPCVIVPQRGVLADLYATAFAAYVGGGFGPGGVHAVIEPAAFGVPMVIGPRHGSSRDAGAMLAEGGAIALPRGARGAALAAAWSRWLDDPAEKNRAGLAARRSLHEGAAAASARRLLELLP